MKKKKRKGWIAYFLDLADMVATRSTCDRKHVGCVLVLDNQVISSGYNGSAPKSLHCDDVGHDLVETILENGKTAPNCVRTTHAEANAVAQAARRGVRTEGATAYVNTFPCWPCFKILASAGIARVVFRDEYREDARVREAAKLAKILIQNEHDAVGWSDVLVRGDSYLYQGAWWVFHAMNEDGLAIVHPPGEPGAASCITVNPKELK